MTNEGEANTDANANTDADVANAAAQPDISELMSRDPLELSDQDLDHMVEVLRNKRQEHMKEKQKPKAKRKNTEAPTDIGDLDLGL